MTPSIALLAAALCAAGGETLARVDGTAIGSEALTRRIEALRRGDTRPAADTVLESLVDEVLLAAEGRRLGLARAPEVVARVQADMRRLAGEAFLAKQVTAKYDPGDAALREMFHASSDFVSFESATFETSEKAKAAADRIKGGASFASEARSAVVSQLEKGPRGLRPMMRAQLDEPLAKALFAAPVGAIVGPVPLEGKGFTLARVVFKEIGSDAQFAARREALLVHARKKFTEQMRKQFTAHLREKSDVKLDQKFLEGLQGLQATPADLEHVIASVKGKPIRYGDIYGTVRALGGPMGHMAGAALKIEMAWREIEKRLLEEIALEKGYESAAEVAALRPEVERAAIANATYEHLRRTASPPTEEEIKAFYDRNAASYGRPFRDVLPDAAAGAAEEKKEAAVAARVAELRKNATISIDRTALAKATTQGG